MASDVKWIKITTDIFDDEKILLIESLPEADSIIVIWFKLLCLAGKQNNSGVFLMSNRIPYTEKMLATIFRRKESTVQMALQTFEQFGMIEIVDGVITIPNWGKHQNLDQLESKKAYQRKYMQEYREKQKQKALTTGNDKENESNTNSKSNCNTNSKSNVSSIERERERERDKEGDKERERESKREPSPAEPPKEPAPALYGIYQNVKLSEKQYITLQEEYPLDYFEKIDRLSTYLETSGKSYNNHFAKIREWAKEDAQKQKKTDSRHPVGNQRQFRGEQMPGHDDDLIIGPFNKDKPKQLPSDEEVEEFRSKMQTEYPDFTPEQHECFVESFRNGTWKK